MTDQLDSETRIKDDDHHALKLWLRLLTCTNLVEAHLRQQLRASFDSTLPRFDLLAQLDRNPEKLRMGELTKLMMVSAGNVTGLVTQLEKEGLVKRTPMKTDRRTFLVGLTKKGKNYFDKMALDHEGWVVNMFAGMDAGQQDELMNDLMALKQSVKASARTSER
jgi:DNA-binding MarR family transcriptional regulator